MGFNHPAERQAFRQVVEDVYLSKAEDREQTREEVRQFFADHGYTARKLAGLYNAFRKSEELQQGDADTLQRRGIPIDEMAWSIANNWGRFPALMRYAQDELGQQPIRGDEKDAEAAVMALIKMGALPKNIARHDDEVIQEAQGLAERSGLFDMDWDQIAQEQAAKRNEERRAKRRAKQGKEPEQPTAPQEPDDWTPFSQDFHPQVARTLYSIRTELAELYQFELPV